MLVGGSEHATFLVSALVFKLAIEPTSPYIYGITDQTLGVSG